MEALAHQPIDKDLGDPPLHLRSRRKVEADHQPQTEEAPSNTSLDASGHFDVSQRMPIRGHLR